MPETFGIVLIAMSATMMVAAGFYGVAPFVFPNRTRGAVTSMSLKRREETNLLPKSGVDSGVIEEVFSELYSLRSTVAALVEVARGGDSVGPADSDSTESEFIAEDGSVEELFSELFALRTTVATLGNDVRNLRSTMESSGAASSRRSRSKTGEVLAVPIEPQPRARSPKRAAA